MARLPYALKVLLENLIRNGEDEGAEAVAKWSAKDEPSQEIAYRPARVLMQDFTGVPAIVDLAAMRDAMEELGGDATKINPLVPVELVIDHSIQVDVFAERLAFQRNAELEFERNRERYAFLRWGQEAFDNFKVVPPNTGICHQVNLEYLGRVVESRDGQAFPDTLVGTDSHTTMINGLGVLGWGVGGIEAEAAMLGQPVSMLVPQVVGFKLTGELPEGSTATDLVLTVTQMLRERGVVGKFVEFCGPGLPNLPLADRATIGNMSPEMGATCAIFPVDAETLRYLEFSGRPKERVELVEAYCREQGLFHDEDSEEATYSDDARAGPGRRGAVARRPEAPAGPGGAVERGRGLPRRARGVHGQRDVHTGYDEAVDESLPVERHAHQQRRRRVAEGGPQPPAARHRGGRARGGLRPRLGRDRGDHELHEHVEPVGDDRRRPARQEGGRGRARADAVGEDLAGAGLEGRDGVPGASRPARAAVEARLRPGGLRLHDLHRELGTAAGGRLARRSRSATWSWRACCPATATSRAASTPR